MRERREQSLELPITGCLLSGPLADILLQAALFRPLRRQGFLLSLHAHARLLESDHRIGPPEVAKQRAVRDPVVGADLPERVLASAPLEERVVWDKTLETTRLRHCEIVAS